MLAEIFMVRSEAEARLVDEVLPSSTSRFIPFSPRSHFVFKETDAKGGESSDKDGPVTEVRSASGWRCLTRASGLQALSTAHALRPEPVLPAAGGSRSTLSA